MTQTRTMSTATPSKVTMGAAIKARGLGVRAVSDDDLRIGEEGLVAHGKDVDVPCRTRPAHCVKHLDLIQRC
jgi:hypothetical protein